MMHEFAKSGQLEGAIRSKLRGRAMVHNGWVDVKLADICLSIDYGYTTSAKEAPVGPKFLRITDIVGGSLDWNRVPYCEASPQEVSRFRLDHGDIVIARTGASTGASAYIREPPGAVFASYLVRLKIAAAADPRFVYFFLQSPQFGEFIQSVLGDKSAQPNASAKTMTQVRLCLPPLSQQRDIALILGALDDKIELNRRMNETLEGIARAVFKSWFVDFDPVIDNALRAGHPIPKPLADRAARRKQHLAQTKTKGPNPATAAFFPNRFQDSPIGAIPEGWQLKTVAEVTYRVTKGDTPRKEALSAAPDSDRMIPMFRVNALTEDGEILVEKLDFIPESIHLGKSRRSILQANDILYKNAGTIGRVSLVHADCLPANTNQAVAIVRPDPNNVLPEYLFMMMRQPEFQTELHSDIVQAVQANLALGKISGARAVFPPSGVLRCLFSPITSILHRVFQNRRESRTLAAIRDTLLPKLLSGEIRVGAAERIVEGVI